MGKSKDGKEKKAVKRQEQQWDEGVASDSSADSSAATNARVRSGPIPCAISSIHAFPHRQDVVIRRVLQHSEAQAQTGSRERQRCLLQSRMWLQYYHRRSDPAEHDGAVQQGGETEQSERTELFGAFMRGGYIAPHLRPHDHNWLA